MIPLDVEPRFGVTLVTKQRRTKRPLPAHDRAAVADGPVVLEPEERASFPLPREREERRGWLRVSRSGESGWLGVVRRRREWWREDETRYDQGCDD